ncbi:cysteine dioxygenase family protein [Actinoallomurus rhizosphaericola]|uniref:cysteine dioxygenase family protein n=1 Tax=Actinoallomurus rhizosphaericola TaxID=2952536 RepID=UPI00209388EF|nr:cysteine dioxygenase family protein [Actinoallomurus rhizosphaericola]MCO5997724.1 cysteine dioxygenase family protein [Actinoallomurus rhizosphaericola]
MTAVLETMRPGLEDLVTGVRAAVDRHADWRETARLVAAELRRHMPTPDVLTAEERLGDPDRYVSHTLYVEPGGTFSLVGLVWRPGQTTPIHDHVTWCVFGVLQGVEHEELYVQRDDHLVRVGVNDNRVGEVSGFAPPGDIHRVRNSGDDIAISLHIYGTDISRVESSVRRVYDLPVRD